MPAGIDDNVSYLERIGFLSNLADFRDKFSRLHDKGLKIRASFVVDNEHVLLDVKNKNKISARGYPFEYIRNIFKNYS